MDCSARVVAASLSSRFKLIIETHNEAEDDGVIAGESEKLGQKINASVAAYKASAIGRSQGLCSRYRSAVFTIENSNAYRPQNRGTRGSFSRIRTSIAATRRSVK